MNDDRESYGKLNEATEDMIAMRDPAQDVRTRQQRRHEARKGARQADPVQPLTTEEVLNRLDVKPRPSPTDPALWGGRLNIYTCDRCHGHIVTRDVDEGVTPFMLQAAEYCPNRCGDGTSERIMMTSSFYRVWDQRTKASYEWYRPATDQVLDVYEREHVSKGGLLIRPCADA